LYQKRNFAPPHLNVQIHPPYPKLAMVEVKDNQTKKKKKKKKKAMHERLLIFQLFMQQCESYELMFHLQRLIVQLL